MTRLRTREGKLSFFLLVLMLLCITWSVELAGWVEGLYVAEWTALGGLFLGFVLTRLGWPRILSHLLGSVAGASLVLSVMGRSMGSGIPWRAGIGMVAYHFDTWLRVVMSGRPSTDAVTFILLMTLLGWWVGYVCSWMVFGAHKVWQALALTGATMMVVAYGSPPEVAPFFVAYVVCALLLAVRLYVFTQEEAWTGHNARYDRDITLHFLRDGGLLVLAVVAAVWIVPLLSSSSLLSDLWARLEGPWRAVSDEWNRLFSGVTGYAQGYEVVPFGQQLALGGPVELGDDIIMWVETSGPQYWRGTVYDQYDGRGWKNTDTMRAVVEASRILPEDGQYEMRWLVEQTFVPNWSGVGQVFYLGEPRSVDLPVDIRFGFANSSEDLAQDPWSAPASVSSMKTRVRINPNTAYKVFSSTSDADVSTLRAAGDIYPAWITRRYLQLPLALPDRVRQLAEEIVEPYDNAYDQAVAIRDYLRRTIQYREDIEAPPEGRDGVDYLLFDSQEGYCNYYASAMVVMARTVGIPGRLAVGYVSGDLDEDSGRYMVRERNTHAWVEIYFPGFGWVEFEPTASEPPIARRDSSLEERPEAPGEGGESDLERDLDRLREDQQFPEGIVVPTSGPPPPSSRILGLAVLAACAGAGALVVWYLRRGKALQTSVAQRVYKRMCQYARLLGVKGQTYQTPYEYASLVSEQVPRSAIYVGKIADIYVSDRFSPHASSSAEELAAAQAWDALRPIVQRRLVRRIPELALSALRRLWENVWEIRENWGR